jgi:AcrR family transcriptional regulator
MNATASARGKREVTKAQNRAAILDAAKQAFSELGYGAVNVREIVRRTDLASGTFYNYFPDKEAVFRVLIGDFGGGLLTRLRAIRVEARGPEAFVAGAYREFFAYMAAEPSLFSLVRRNAGAITALTEDPVLGAAVRDLAEDLATAVLRGNLPDIDPDRMALAMAGAGLELAAHMLAQGPPYDVDGSARFAAELFLGGIERLGRSAGEGAGAGPAR